MFLTPEGACKPWDQTDFDGPPPEPSSDRPTPGIGPLVASLRFSVYRREGRKIVGAKELVLGLLIERPDYAYGLRDRFNALFEEDAEYGETTIYSAIGLLEKEGLIKRFGEPGRLTGRQRDARNGNFRATESGAKYFDRWMVESSPLAPSREELQLKLLLCKPHHAPRMIDIAWAQERQCIDRLESLKRRMQEGSVNAPEALSGRIELWLLRSRARREELRVELLRELRETLKRYIDDQPVSRRNLRNS